MATINAINSQIPIEVAFGGLGAASPAVNTVLVGQATAAIAEKTLTNGQLLIGSTGAAPVPATFTGGTGMTITPTAGDIEVASTVVGFAWSDETGATKQMIAQQGYTANYSTDQLTFTLPTTAAAGNVLAVAGSQNGWVIAQNTGQTIHTYKGDTTTGKIGDLKSVTRYGSVELVCNVTDTDFVMRFQDLNFNIGKIIALVNGRIFGTRSSLVLTDTGHIYGCGFNSQGELGVNNLTKYNVLVEMLAPGGGWDGMPIAIAMGLHGSLVLTDTGHIYGCGVNDQGQLGVNDTTQYKVLVEMLAPGGGWDGMPIAISMGYYDSLVLTDTGHVYGCGNNSSGQLGVDNKIQTSVLVEMLAPGGGWNGMPIAISIGQPNSSVLTDTGHVYGCGSNLYGQLGVDNKIQTSVLVEMLAPGGGWNGMPIAISMGFAENLVLTDTGHVYGCGYNFQGQLGVDNKIQTSVLVEMLAPGGGWNGTPNAISTGLYSLLVLTDTGHIYGCGSGNLGVLGVDSETPTSVLVEMLDPASGWNGTPIALSICAEASLVLTDTGHVYGCGRNSRGELGLNNYTQYYTLQPMILNI